MNFMFCRSVQEEHPALELLENAIYFLSNFMQHNDQSEVQGKR